MNATTRIKAMLDNETKTSVSVVAIMERALRYYAKTTIPQVAVDALRPTPRSPKAKRTFRS